MPVRACRRASRDGDSPSAASRTSSRREGRAVHGALWWLSRSDVRRLDAYEGAPSNYRRETVEVKTGDGPLTAMTYVMTEPCYVGLPSRGTWVESRPASPLGPAASELERAFRETHLELVALGIDSYVPDGRKRMRAVGRDGTRFVTQR